MARRQITQYDEAIEQFRRRHPEVDEKFIELELDFMDASRLFMAATMAMGVEMNDENFERTMAILNGLEGFIARLSRSTQEMRQAARRKNTKVLIVFLEK